MSQGQGQGGPPRWPGPGGQRPQSPFRGPPPRPGQGGWGSPIPPRMTQSPPPFLIRPMVGGHSPFMRPGSPVPRSGSPVPFGPPPPRWSPAPGTPMPHPMAPGTPVPPHMMGPRPFFRPIIPSPSPPVGYPPMPPPPPREIFSPDFSLQPSYDVEFVYPAGVDPETHMRRQQMSAGPSQSQEDDENGPSTADIIAAQSQDYVDERLAEYQATIQHLQDEQERVQKKTFVNWINSYLAKHVPPLHIVDLIEDLKDGTRLLALLEVLSGEKLPVEKGRNLRRPHFLSNCNTALEFLQKKKIKLVNINSSDVVDGRPPVVLGLVWTIILYFQIEENTKVLASLGYRFGAPTPTPGLDAERSETSRLESPGNKHGRITPSERWRDGARKALLAWVKELASKKFGVAVNDFGSSWRDGNAFLAIVNSIRPGLVDIEGLRKASNRTRLETAFRVAECELGVTRLLDPEDVDVPRPDEKSIMTYVAQFLHKSNEPRLQADSFSAIQAIYDELLTWLMQKTQYMEHMKQTNALPMVYRDYLLLQNEFDLKSEPYHRLKTLIESQSMIGITDEAWSHLNSLWKKLESQLKEWQWRLDASLPEPFGRIGQWLAKAELLVSSDDVPSVMDDETARVLNAKIEDHKAFFVKLPEVLSEFTGSLNTSSANQVPSEQLESMAKRLHAIGPLASRRAIKLKFLEHKCCLVAFIILIETRLKNWTVKYGREDHVKTLLDQYNNFVNRNKIFQEFDRAYIDMQHVIEEYKRDGGIDVREGRVADHFLWEIGERWKSVSMELRCLQSMLEEVIAYWRRYDSIAPELNDWIDRSIPMLHLPEEERMEYFQDVSVWHEKYQLLNDTVSFLAATCDPSVVNELRENFSKIQVKWESLFPHVKQYQYAGQMLRMRKDFLQTLSGLQKWLRNAEELLAAPQPVNVEAARHYNKQLQSIMLEIDEMDEQWRVISKKFQALLPELSGEEVDRLMKTIKKEKESLVRVRAQLPQRQAYVHQLLTQQESLEAGQQEIAEWLNSAEVIMNSYVLTGGPQALQQQLEKHRLFFAKTLYYKTMLDSKNKLVSGIVRAASPVERSQVEGLVKNMQNLSEHFKRVENNAQLWEQKLHECIRCWRNYEENKQTVCDWMATAEKLLQERNLESKQTVEAHKNYFDQINDRPLRHMNQASHDLRQWVSPEEYDHINRTVEQLQSKWNKIMTAAPIHLTKLEFRLEEDTLASLLKEMDREISNEHQLLNKKEDSQSVLTRHINFFEKGKVPSQAQACIEKLSQMETRYTIQHPEDSSLKEQLGQAKAASNTISDRVKNLRVLLEDIPLQWNAYKAKYEEVVLWMDSVDVALKNILVEDTNVSQFEAEKAKFIDICREVDRRREDMKTLVQMLDALVSRRADDEALKEQDLLEQLITRYKNMVPTIEMTMIKTETHSRCYTYREEAQKVCQALNKVDELAVNETQPGTLEEVEALIGQQQNLIKQLEGQRTTIVSLLQKGKDLQKDPHSPSFIKEQVEELEKTWNDTYGHANEKLKQLKGTQKVWVEYRSQRDDILNLLGQAEVELKKIVPRHDPKQVANDLRAKQDMSVALREATENMLKRLRDLAQSLGQVSGSDKQPVLEKEVQEIEERLKLMLDLLDDKVANLGQYNEKWNSLGEKIHEMSNWMKGAQKALQQLLSSDMTPEERLKKTKELQDQITERLEMLRQIEQEAQELLKAGDEEPIEGKIVMDQVDSLKEELVCLHETVSVQNAQTVQALQAWEECQADLQEVHPWLEQSEQKVAVGWDRPTTLADAQKLSLELHDFAADCTLQQVRLSDAAKRSEKIGNMSSALDEVDVTMTKWATINSAVTQWKDKTDNLVKNWEKYELSLKPFENWLAIAEKSVQKPLDRKALDVNQLEAALGQLKNLNKEISEHQSKIISITQECDVVSQSVSPEGAKIINANLSQLKNRLMGLSNEVRGKMNYLSDSIIARQEFDTKISDFEQWMNDFSSKQTSCEVYFDKLDQALQQVHVSVQEHSDRLSQFREIDEDVKMFQTKTEITRPYEDLGRSLSSRKAALSSWVQLAGWISESNSAIEYCDKQLGTPGLKKNKIHEIEQAIDNLSEKCDEWLPKAQNLDSLSGACELSVLDHSSSLPLSAAKLVTDTKNKLNRAQKSSTSLLEETEKIGSQLEKLKALDTEIKTYFQDTEEKLANLNSKTSDLSGVQDVKDRLQGLVEKHAKMESVKSNIHRLGSDLIKADPSSSTEFQNMIQNVDANYDKIQTSINDKWTNLVDIIDLWNRYNDCKDTVSAVLTDADDLSSSALKGVPSDSTTATALLDHLKKCNDVLNKKKNVVENCATINQQLCTALEPLTQFDSTALPQEMALIRNSYDSLIKSISEQVPKVQTKLLLWQTIETSKDDLMKWLSDTYSSLEETQNGLCNSDLARLKLGQYKDELSEKYNMKMSVQSKVNQLKKMNAGSSIPNLDSIVELIEEGFVELDKLSKDLEKSLGSFEDKELELKKATKLNTEKLLKLKESISKCEDRSGTPLDVLNRLQVLKQAKSDCVDLKPFIDEVDVKIAALKEEYPSWDNSLLTNDLKTQKKRYGICESQLTTVNTALISVLEKNFQDKYHGLAKIVHSLVEKIKWCDPSNINDNFSLEAKRSALNDVCEGIKESHEKVPSVQDAFGVLQDIPTYPKLQEQGDTLNKILNDLMVVEKNYNKMQGDFNEFSQLWNSFSKVSDEISAWLKDFEGIVRSESLNQVSLPELQEKIEETQKLARDVQSCEEKLANLNEIGNKILQISPEARTGQISTHLNNRLQAVSKFVNSLKDRLADLSENKKQYNEMSEKAHKWIDDANRQLKDLDTEKTPGSTTTVLSQDKLAKLKDILKSKAGLELLNKTVEAGEAIVPGVTTDSKETVRKELRDLRDKWEAHIDCGNALTKKLEAVQMQWSSFGESVSQLEGWFEDVRKKVEKLNELQPNLADKKSTLQNRRTLLQDISSHSDIIVSLKDKMREFSDDESSKKLDSFTKSYDVQKKAVQEAVGLYENHVAQHEKFDFITDNFEDWLKRLQGELRIVSEEPLSEKSDSEARLDTLKQLQQYKAEGDAELEKCSLQLSTVIPQTAPSGHPPLNEVFNKLKITWEEFGKECKSAQDRIEKEHSKLSVFQKELEDLTTWLKQKEFQVKDPSFKSTVETKSAHLSKLEGIRSEIAERESLFEKLVDDASSIPGDAELQTKVAQLNTRYQALTQPLNDLINKFKAYLTDHESFNISHAEFLKWIDQMKKQCKDLSEIVGDMTVLQDRKQKLTNLMDERVKKTSVMETLAESGEKLYSHTSPDGREIIRQQIRTVRDGWETLGEQMQSSWQKLDACLSQFADFTTSQEELTKWLKGIEQSMQIHTQLKATLQEKKAQLQNHRIVHQEIASHQVLVEAVCEKAQQLVDLTQDRSLQIYITSIKQLFQDIKTKSKDLLEKLETCMSEHSKLNDSLREYSDWKNNQRDLLTSLDDLTGEKADIVRRLDQLENLKLDCEKGSALLEKVEELAGTVCLSTSEAGTKAIEQDVTSARDSYDKYVANVENASQKLQKVLENWQNFEVGLQNNTKWFREQEAVFRAQVLQSTLPEKEKSLQNYTSQRKIVTDFENEVTAFLDQSHVLLQASNAERIKPLVMQISNRYQLLHVLSKEVVNKWQGIVDDHQSYETKFSEASDLLTSFEESYKKLSQESNMDARNSELQHLSSEKEQILHKINVLVQLADKLYPDTASTGREKIRQDLRNLRDRFDKVDENITELQKKQNTESQQWSSYQDNLQQTLVWLANMEKAAAVETPNWLSIPDTKSKLMKLKSVLQDAISHKRIVEGVIEKAQSLIQRNLGPNPEEVKNTIDDINTRYEALLNNMLVSITHIEETLDSMQHYNDVVKKEQDWQKNLWEQLNLCTDYSGGKPALQSRLSRVEELKSGVGEGQVLMDTLESVLQDMGDTLPLSAKETLEKDATNLKFDLDKLKAGLEEVRHTLQERLSQWNSYEDGFERLLAWLGEAEGTLKAYSHCNTLEEKEEQHSKYQNLLKTLKDNEASFDKMGIDSTELMQATGESRISNNIQQITSRFQSVQMTAKEILKKCEQAVSDHKVYRDKHNKFLDWLKDMQEKSNDLKEITGTSEQLEVKLTAIKELLQSRSANLANLNAVVEAGEKLYPCIAAEGRDIVRAELQELQSAFDFFYDDLGCTERELNGKLSRWSGFEDSKLKLQNWLSDMEKEMPKEIELKGTLDEKRAQLQKYRTMLHDISSHQQDVIELKDKGSSLPEGADDAVRLADSLSERHKKLLQKAHEFVEQYEGIVCFHQQYVKAIQDTTEWIDGTHSTVIMWSDENQERINLHANLEKLKNLQMSFPEEAYRIDEIRSVAEKVIPGTVDNGQENIRNQVDSSQQEWESLLSTVNSSIESINLKLKLWNEFEAKKDECMNWLKDTDSRIHAVDLKPTLETKIEELNSLKSLQGEIKAKELEIDAISELALNLQRQVVTSKTSSASSSDLTIKYQQISHKIKELTNKWQGYVSSNQEFDTQLDDCSRWLSEIREKLAYCSDLSASSQKDLETKLGTVHDLLMYKDEGYAKVQSVVELAQSILANTATTGHPEINSKLQKLQDEWSGLAAKMVDTKNQLDESIHKWAGFLEQIHQLRKTVEYLESVFKDVKPFQTTIQEKRSQLETIRSLEEKMICERLEVESLKGKASEMMASGQQSQAASQAQEVLKKFDSLGDEIRRLKNEREAQFKDHKAYKEAGDELMGWLTRAREKIPSFKQRSIGDRLVDVESAGSMLTSLMNKQPQGSLLVERLQQSGEVAMASTSDSGKELIQAEIRALNENFEGLFKEIQQQKDGLEATMLKLRGWKEEHERLSDWLQQCEILIKAAKTTLVGSLGDKKKQVADMHEVISKLETGNAQIQKFNEAAEGLLASYLDAYVGNQLRQLNSRYQVQLNMGKDVLKKVEANLEQHQQFLTNYEQAQNWMEKARNVIQASQCSQSTSEGRKERLQASLAKIQELFKNQEEGQNLVHNTVSWGEKSLRNTRSDGRDTINTQMKDIQAEWDRLVKKIASTKVSLETSLLQWADYNSSYSQVSQWISDREAKLQKVSEQKPSRTRKRHPTPGMSSASIGDRKATLRATNTIVQDIVSLEPMIESVTSKAENLMQESPASEISTKYTRLTKQAQEIYARQKEIVQQHQAFVDLAAEFMNWMRGVKERLAKISEPVGDKETLSGKITLLKVLQSELPEGQTKLDAALIKGSQACVIVDDDDRELIEEEVAVLQEEFDTYSESLTKTQMLLETGLVRWREWEDLYGEAEEWMNKTEAQVKSFNQLQNTLTDKKNALEQFQAQLQTIFDWQKELDRLNHKGQLLLETCADSRISNAVTQMSTKFSALLSLAKEVIRRLELHYQEHQQHNALYQECQDWIDRTREKLVHISDLNYSLSDVNSRLQSVKGLKQTLEQGQNKLRYALELKEKVMLATEPTGAAKIDEDTELLKSEFDKLMSDIQDTRQKLAVRATLLEELEKADKIIQDWLQEIELKINVSEGNQYVDLSEKRTSLEKLRGIEKEVIAQYDMLSRLEAKMNEDTNMPKDPYMPTFVRYEYIKNNLEGHIKRLEGIVKEHEDYWKQLNETTDFLRKLRVDLQQFSDCHGEKCNTENKLSELASFGDSLSQGDILVKKAKEMAQKAMMATSADGKDSIQQECHQLQFELDSLSADYKDQQKSIKKCLDCWNEFEKAFENSKIAINGCEIKLKSEPAEIEKATPEDLERCKKLMAEVTAVKFPLEDLSDKCETLMEFSAAPSVRDSTVQLQSQYSLLVSGVQALLVKVQKSLSDHTDFVKEKHELEEWLNRAEGTLLDCSGFGDEAATKEKLETVKIVSTRLTEGQHLLSVLQDSFARVMGVIPIEQQESMRENVTSLRSRWEKLNMDVKNSLSDLKDASQRWEDFKENCQKFSRWCESVEEYLIEKPFTRAELGDMKTLLERYKNLQSDIVAQKADLDSLEGEAGQLALWSSSDLVKAPVNKLKERWNKLDAEIKVLQSNLEKEIGEHADYHNALQDTEKWLLQTSFQLMAHNSLYITNREQTLDQVAIHEGLLEEIQAYQLTLDDVKAKGHGQINRYISSIPQIENTIEKQLKNVQDSYESLLHTGLQIKKRLIESLAKFQEYEDTLESIMQNLDKWEPEICETVEAPIDNIEASSKRLEYIRSVHNRLQGEKNRLSLAVQSCEAATATLSRPASPQETILQPIPDKELAVRGRLEDLIDQKQVQPVLQSAPKGDDEEDKKQRIQLLLEQSHAQTAMKKIDDICVQIQTHMAQLSSASVELDEVRLNKDTILRWMDDVQGKLKEIQQRPAKLRSDTAQVEMNQLQDIRQGIADRLLQLAEIEMQEAGLVQTKYQPDLEQKLTNLDNEVAKVIDSRMNVHAKINDYRAYLTNTQAWLDGLSNKLEPLEKGGGLTLTRKGEYVNEILKEFDDGVSKLEDVKKAANEIMPSISNVDCQMVEEQIKSLDRRHGEMKKRITRKQQILGTTVKSYEDFKKDLEDCKQNIQSKISPDTDRKLGFEITPLETYHQSLKTSLKEVEGKQAVLDTLDRRLTTLQPELEEAEIIEAESALADVLKLLTTAGENTKKHILEVSDAVTSRRKFNEKVDNVKSWISRMSGEFKDAKTIPLAASDVLSKIESLKKQEGVIKDFSDGQVSEMKREAENLEKECNPTQCSQLQALVNGIENDIQGLNKDIQTLVKKYNDALKQRQNFEESFLKCQNWLQEAETAVASDVKGSANIDVLEEQYAKYNKLQEEALKLTPEITSVTEKGKSLVPSLNEPDRQILADKLSSLTTKLGTLSGNIGDKLSHLQAAINEFQQASNIIEESMKHLNEVKAEVLKLNRPVGSGIEDSQGLLSAYEDLHQHLKAYRGKLESTHLPSYKRKGDLQTVMKDQDDLISHIELQIQRLRHLLLLQQQFMALVTEITNFIIKYTEVVKEIEKSGVTVEEKIKKYTDIITRIQECEALLATAIDKGARIADEGTVTDRNSITEQLQSLKQQLLNLRRAVENKRAEHELTLAEHKKYAADLDAAIAWLHEKETVIKSRPLLERGAMSIDLEIRKHEELSKDVNDKLQQIAAIENALKHDDGLPPTLVEKISETRLLLKTLPEELQSRLKYLEENKTLRQQYEDAVANITKWIQDARCKLSVGEGGVDFENIQANIADHKTFFGNEKSVLAHVQVIKQHVDKIWPSLPAPEQEIFSKDQEELIERVQNTFNSAKSHQARLEQNAHVWKNYLDLLDIVQGVISKAELPEEPATTVGALKNNLSNVQSAYAGLQNQQQEIDNMNERARSVEKEADMDNRQKIQNQMKTINTKWMEALAALDARKDAISKLVTQWEQCETLWQAFESGLSAIEEHFSQIDPSIRSQQQLQETKEAISVILNEAKQLGTTHTDLLHYAKFILNHLNSTSDICYSTLKSKLEHLSTQYQTILTLLEEKLEWLNNQGQFLTEIDENIEKLQNKLEVLDSDIQSINPFDSEVVAITKKLDNLGKDVDETGKSIADFNTKLKEKFSSLKQVLPTSISKNISNLELGVEKVASNLEDKKQEVKRACNTRQEFKCDLEAVKEWLVIAEDRLQNRSAEPHLLKENLQNLQAQLPSIIDRMEKAQKSGKIIIEKTPNNKEREDVQNALEGASTQLDQIKATIDERKLKIAESLDSWQRFLQLHAQVMAWAEEKTAFLQPLHLSSITETRHLLGAYGVAVKSLKNVNKQLSEMGQEIDKVAETSSPGPLHEKFEEAEKIKIDIEAQIIERNALIQETSEEWEKCERKLHEAQSWIEKSQQSLQNAAGKRKPLRDQLASRDKVLADVAVQKTKVALAVDKLQVHFKAGIGGDPNVAKEASELQKALAEFETEVKSQCSALESAVSEIDKLQEEVQQLRSQLSSSEQQLRNISSPAYLPDDKEKAAAEQKSLKEKLKTIQSKITSRNERIKLLMLSGVPSPQPLDS